MEIKKKGCYTTLICDNCNSIKFKMYKYKCTLNNLEIIAPIYKCLSCGKEYIDSSIPQEIQKLVIKHKIKEKTRDILNFFSTHKIKNFMKEIRLKEGLSQSEVAERAGVKPQRIYALEKESFNIKLETAYRLGVSLECENITELWRYFPAETQDIANKHVIKFIPPEVIKHLSKIKTKQRKTEAILNFFSKYKIKCFIKEVRQLRGLSQSEVGRRAGVKPQRIYALENEPFNVKLETAYRLVIALECNSISELWRYVNTDNTSIKNMNIIKR